MKSIPFPGATLQIGKGQPEYNVIHAMPVPGPEGELIICFELTDEEIEHIVRNKKIFYRRWTFGQTCRACGQVQSFQPLRIDTDLSDGIEFIKEEE